MNLLRKVKILKYGIDVIFSEEEQNVYNLIEKILEDIFIIDIDYYNDVYINSKGEYCLECNNDYNQMYVNIQNLSYVDIEPLLKYLVEKKFKKKFDRVSLVPRGHLSFIKPKIDEYCKKN